MSYIYQYHNLSAKRNPPVINLLTCRLYFLIKIFFKFNLIILPMSQINVEKCKENWLLTISSVLEKYQLSVFKPNTN